MISILIPVYNYTIVDLVTNLQRQLQLSGITYEIICFDDASDKDYVNSNKVIQELENVIFKISNKNNGRTQTRQNLANTAKYEWLLFLDADVIPKSKSYIKNYISYIDNNYDAVFGGFAYSDKKPDANYRLRWKYGKMREQKQAKNRNQKPYKVIISANFLIKKNLFLSINAEVEENTYGLDNIFGAKLKSKKAKVHHINNEVYHLGIENNSTYLKKKEDSALTVLNYYRANKVKDHQNDLLNLFIKSKRYGFNYIFNLIYKLFGRVLKKNLTCNNPSIRLLQLYRISFMCYKDLQ